MPIDSGSFCLSDFSFVGGSREAAMDAALLDGQRLRRMLDEAASQVRGCVEAWRVAGGVETSC